MKTRRTLIAGSPLSLRASAPYGGVSSHSAMLARILLKHQSRATMVVMPMPPPTQSVARPSS